MGYTVTEGERVVFLCGNPNYEPNAEKIAALKARVGAHGAVFVGTQAGTLPPGKYYSIVLIHCPGREVGCR